LLRTEKVHDVECTCGPVPETLLKQK
jgi:hypothetical protein